MADPNRPTLFSALEALGLKLEAQNAPLETLFIDHIERGRFLKSFLYHLSEIPQLFGR
jgi:hypothetical protein